MSIRLAGATLNQTPLDWQGNKQRIIEAIDLARSKSVEILCLPELAITGYGCEDLFLSEWLYKKAQEMLIETIPHCRDIVVAIGLPVKHQGSNYNTVCVVENQIIKGFYAKQNMALDGVHYEPRWFKPWTTGVIEQYTIEEHQFDFGDYIYEYKRVKVGFEICEDAWRQERPACELVKKGVKLILNPSASHFAFGKTVLREELVVNSSSEFDCTYVYANLLGNEAGRMIYDGEILIAKDGLLLNRNQWLSFKDYNLVIQDVDILNVNSDLQVDLPEFNRSREHEFAQASSLALFDYLRKSRSDGFTLSLSGGADSSTIAIIVSEMVKRGVRELGLTTFLKKLGISLSIGDTLGETEQIKSIVNQILTCAYQGTKNSSEATHNSARQLAADIGATFHYWLIDEEVNSYTSKVERALGRKLTWSEDDIALQNIQARSRSPIIWMMANIENRLLLTTSNRSEGDVGYATMDGDTSGSISPIAAVDKHFILQWLQWAESNLGYASLNYVNSLDPSAELRPLETTQTDEKDLMPYHIIVAIEKLAIRDHKSPLEVFEILNNQNIEDTVILKEHIKKFFRLWAQNQWKRERIAPSFHLDDFNVDPRTWCRFPILSNAFKEELEQL